MIRIHSVIPTLTRCVIYMLNKKWCSQRRNALERWPPLSSPRLEYPGVNFRVLTTQKLVWVLPAVEHGRRKRSGPTSEGIMPGRSFTFCLILYVVKPSERRGCSKTNVRTLGTSGYQHINIVMSTSQITYGIDVLFRSRAIGWICCLWFVVHSRAEGIILHYLGWRIIPICGLWCRFPPGFALVCRTKWIAGACCLCLYIIILRPWRRTAGGSANNSEGGVPTV